MDDCHRKDDDSEKSEITESHVGESGRDDCRPHQPQQMTEYNTTNSVLPEELQRNFACMRAMVDEGYGNGRKRKDTVTNTASEKSMAEEDSPEEVTELEKTEFESKKLRMAIRTAVAVENEVSRLRNGIIEMEALLARQQGGEVVSFPSLPPVVASDESTKQDDEGTVSDYDFFVKTRTQKPNEASEHYVCETQVGTRPGKTKEDVTGTRECGHGYEQESGLE